MCGRYLNRSQKQALAERMRATKVFPEAFEPNYNIAPTTLQPIVREERASGDRELVLARWGLVPFFAKSLAEFKGVTTINAKAETLVSSALWRDPLKSRRCLVPADGFYEWKALDASRKPKKQPFVITLNTGEPMAFAGLWDAWKAPKASPQAVDTWLQSFTIITTEANELMSTIHTRMPAILPQSDWAAWLDRDPDKPAPLHLLRPFDSSAMILEPCNPAMNNAKNNGPEMMTCPNPDEPISVLNSL